jgi:hypothetical protein
MKSDLEIFLEAKDPLFLTVIDDIWRTQPLNIGGLGFFYGLYNASFVMEPCVREDLTMLYDVYYDKYKG